MSIPIIAISYFLKINNCFFIGWYIFGQEHWSIRTPIMLDNLLEITWREKQCLIFHCNVPPPGNWNDWKHTSIITHGRLAQQIWSGSSVDKIHVLKFILGSMINLSRNLVPSRCLWHYSADWWRWSVCRTPE